MSRIIFTLAVVSFSSALAQWLHAQEGSSTFAPTLSNKTKAPGKAPEGMVWIPGGEFSMGAAVNGEGSHEMPMASNDSQPVPTRRTHKNDPDKSYLKSADGWKGCADFRFLLPSFPVRLYD